MPCHSLVQPVTCGVHGLNLSACRSSVSDPGRAIWEVTWVGDGALRGRRQKPGRKSLQRIEGVRVRPQHQGERNFWGRRRKWDPRSKAEALALQMPPEMSRSCGLAPVLRFTPDTQSSSDVTSLAAVPWTSTSSGRRMGSF